MNGIFELTPFVVRHVILAIALLVAIQCGAQPTLTYLNSLNQKAFDDQTYVSLVVAGPMLDASGRRMIFSQADGAYLVKKSADGSWKKPVKILAANKSLFLDGVMGFNGRRLFYDDGPTVNYIELQDNGFWSSPHIAFDYNPAICEIVGAVQSNHEKLAISPDADLVVFSKYNKAINGSRSMLYFARRDKSGSSWSYTNCKPVNGLSNESEIRPILLPDGKTLLYTLISNRREGSNSNSTIERQYVTQLMSDGTWALPQPTGTENYSYTWSSPNLDTAYFRTKTGRIGYAVDPAGVIIPRPVETTKHDVIEKPRAIVAEPVVEKKATPAIVGRYYALLIGVSDYENDKLDLTMPVNDVKAMKEVLSNSYSFDESDITILDNPTRQGIFKELSRLRNTLTDRDNLLIFFAGHGSWDKKINQGYWWPSNSSPEDPSNWLSNSDLREQIRGIPSAHTLLISDACFSGGIFRTRNAEDIKKAPIEVAALYRMKSRRAITSGALSSVPDESVFIRYLIKRLEENPDNYLPSQSLFNSMRLAVIHNSLTVPQDGVISDAGDEGGDFIFIRRQ